MPDINPANFHLPSEENLRLISFCPVCHYRYNPVEARVLEENESAHLLYIKCHRCHSATLALILASALGISSIGLVTDLDSHEVSKFKDLSPVNDDDVLTVHRWLQVGRLEKMVLS
jgi:hypothetical protein